MSFYINNTNMAKPGPIGNNGLNGLCEKVLIETTKVFDACLSQTTETGVILQLANFTPADPVLPLTYVSSQASSSQATISDLVIDRIDSCPNYANVTATIRRKKDGQTVAAIVGYTNAGKSTLLNLLTQADVLAENKLFATLDPTQRNLTLSDNRELLMVDTVGFIRKLPHHLVNQLLNYFQI